LERFGRVLPLRVDRRILIRRRVARGSPKLGQLRLCIVVPPEFVVRQRQTPLIDESVAIRFARGTGSLKVTFYVLAQPEKCVSVDESGIKG
jgi:hypothetical protein